VRTRVLVGIALFSLLFVFLLTATQASSTALESARIAASLEEWYDFQPTGWVASSVVTCTIKVYNEEGFIDDGRYKYSTDGGASWSSEQLDIQIDVIGENRRQLTVTGLSFPHSLTEDQNQIMFAILDQWGAPLWSSAYSVRIDTVAPNSVVETSGCYNSSTWPGAITGTASDSGSGVSSVEITLRRSSDGRYYNGTSWQTSPAWLATVGTTSWSYSFAPEEDVYTVQSRARDAAGNEETTYGQSMFSYDMTLPQSEVWTTGYFNAESWTGGIAGSASDSESGVAYVQITLHNDSANLYYDGSSWSSTPQWLTVSGTVAWSYPFMPPVDAVYTVQSRAVDNCGNVQSEYGEAVFTYDNTAPLAPSNLLVTPSGWSGVNSFDITWDNPDDISGIVAVHYKWDSAPTSNDDESSGSPLSGAGINSISDLAVPVQGAHQLFLWLEDAAGNVAFQRHSATAEDAFKWDAHPPLTSISNLDGSHGCGEWYTSAVQVTLSAEDENPDPGTINATSGISATFWRENGGSWQQGTSFQITGEATHTLEYYSVDVAGNQEAVQAAQVNIDSVPPTTSGPNYTGFLGNNGWYTSTVSVALIALDATSGVSATYHQVDNGTFQPGAEFDIVTEGVHNISYYSVDFACNQEAVQTATLKIDKTYPATTHQLEGVLVGEWFTDSPVTVTLSASDTVTGVETSGVDAIRYRIDYGGWQQYTEPFVLEVSSGNEREYTVRYSATDLAGNVEPVHELSVGIDRKAPGTIPHVPMVQPSGWTNTNCFTVTWDENPHDLSGIGGAYYNFSEPSSSTDGTLVLGDDIMSIPCVQVPDELGDGAHNVYVWLQDKAGNSDHLTRRVITVRLDRIPPEIAPAVTGDLCEATGWYNSPIAVTFVATDNIPSGMVGGVISYHVVGGGGWVEGDSYYESRDGRYTIECRAQDAAGNVSDIVTTTVKLDQTAPQAPMGMWVDPAGWSNENSFTISWLNPGDLSGLAGVYYKQGSPPISSTDGIYVDGGQSSLSDITAIAEGETPVYIWLVDKACNSDYRNRAMVTLKYDNTPPTTTFAASGILGGDGWYISPVQVTLNCADNASGWASSHYRIGNGSWQNGTSFLIDAEGVVTFSYYSVDAAGNVEATHTGSVKIDRVPPSSHAYADSYSKSSSFTIRWDGSDASSGIAAFDVQYKIGTAGAWQDWALSLDPSQKSKLFTGAVPGKTYYFRTRARDRAGNVEPYPAMADVYVSIDPLLNGDFEQGSWLGWERSGVCQPTQVITQSYSGGTTHAVVLGCPDQKNGAPVGASMVCQTIAIPNAQDMPAPMLYFRYRIFTYDVLWSQRYHRFYDSFNVGWGPPGEIEPTWVFTDGNRTQIYDQLMDLGWREGAIDLKPYAGQTIKICLANVTRVDEYFNTWTVVDDIRLVNLERKLYLPIVLRDTRAAGQLVKVYQNSVYPELKAKR